MEYSLLKQGNAVVLHVASGVGALTLDATKLDFFIGALEQMRETMTPPPPTKVQPPKGAEMPVNLNRRFRVAPDGGIARWLTISKCSGPDGVSIVAIR